MKLYKYILIVTFGFLVFISQANADDDNDVVGKKEFMQYCASCHGSSGKGDGPVVDFLKRKPADLTVLTKNNDGHFPFDHLWGVFDGTYQAKEHGTSEMPIWGYKFIRETQTENEPSSVAKAKALDIILYLQVIQE